MKITRKIEHKATFSYRFMIFACMAFGMIACRNNKSNVKAEVEEPVAVEAQNIETSQMVDLGLSVKWAGYNLGASSPEQSGNYYAWGETKVKNEYSKDTYTYFDNDTRTFTNIGFNISGTENDVAVIEWGDSWRLPSKFEVEELTSKCEWVWATYKGVNGYMVTGPNKKSIFLPAAGMCRDYEVKSKGERGYYWTGELYPRALDHAYCLYINSKSPYCDFQNLQYGIPIRPVTK